VTSAGPPNPKEGGRRRSSKGGPRFVIQKHDASRLHYDLRVEVGGVMKSWAVPKGPSTNPKDKRLAVPTEDHPIEYNKFEGTIPEGEYGAGTVLVWDEGTYRNLSETPIEEGLEKGHITVWLEGKKLKGGYALTRIRRGKPDAWLLVKMDDEEADPKRDPVRDEPASVRSGRTIEEIAAQP
jgi:DNA ligase D-like protein (predicted 3'-phosphoesterase)